MVTLDIDGISLLSRKRLLEVTSLTRLFSLKGMTLNLPVRLLTGHRIDCVILLFSALSHRRFQP